ncbi:MAG TPA: hypothetical protein VF600_04300 [Abditibacteriaceae bacterium]|jgi:hypothetical protein
MISDDISMDTGNNTPQSAQKDARRDVPVDVSYVIDNPDIEDDSLPLDGSITTKDTEPTDQSGLHPDEGRILRGSEASQTAEQAVDVSTVPPPDAMSDNQTANTLNDS